MKTNISLKLFTLLTAFVIMTTLFSFSAFATGNAEFSIPKSVAAGSDFSVSVKVSADKDIGFVTAMLTYDDTVAQFSSSDNASGGDGIINLKGFPDDVSKELTFNINFKAIKNGDCKMNLTNCFVTSPEGDQIGSPTAYATVTVTGGQTVSSSSKDSQDSGIIGSPTQGCLKSLTVSEGVLKPDFSYDIYDYRVNVDADVETCEIEGVTANETDYIWYTGSDYLAVGDNIRTVKVTDKDGYSHVYTVIITRAALPSSQDEEDSSDELVSEVSAADSSNSDNSSSLIIVDDEDGMAKYRKILTPALIIILIALIIALVVLVVWLKNKRFDGKKGKTKRK